MGLLFLEAPLFLVLCSFQELVYVTGVCARYYTAEVSQVQNFQN